MFGHRTKRTIERLRSHRIIKVIEWHIILVRHRAITR